MGVGIYYFYHGFGLKEFEGRHIRIQNRHYHHLIKKLTSPHDIDVKGMKQQTLIVPHSLQHSE